MAKANKKPSQIDQDKLTAVVAARADREAVVYQQDGKNAVCTFDIAFTDLKKARVIFFINDFDNVALYELNYQGNWYCSHDWRD